MLNRDRFGLDEDVVAETLAMIKSRGINCEGKPLSEINDIIRDVRRSLARV